MEAVVDEAAQGVLVLFVVCGGLRDAGRFAEAVSGGRRRRPSRRGCRAFFGDEALGEASTRCSSGTVFSEWD